MKTANLVDRYTRFSKSYLCTNSIAYLVLYVTSRCNLTCKMCFYADSLNAPTGDGLSLEELEKVSRSLPRLMQLTLTGGEPFLRKDLDQIIEMFYMNSAVRAFTIPTNGTYTEQTFKVMSRVLKSCPAATFKVGMSLDGPMAVHNAIRGSRSSYAQLSATHAMLRKLQRQHDTLILTMSGVLSSYNLSSVKELVDLYFENFPADDYTMQFARGNTRENDAKIFEVSDYLKAVDYIELKAKAACHHASLTKTMVRALTASARHIVAKTAWTNECQIQCVAGKRLAILYDTGVLTPCEVLATFDLPTAIRDEYNNFAYGNIRDFDCDVQKAINTPLGRNIYQYIRQTRCHCTFECAVVASMFFQPLQLLITLAAGSLPRMPGSKMKHCTVAHRSPVGRKVSDEE